MFRIVIKKAATALVAKRPLPSSGLASTKRMASTTIGRSGVQPIIWIGGGIAVLTTVGYGVMSTSKGKEKVVESVDTAPTTFIDTTTTTGSKEAIISPNKMQKHLVNEKSSSIDVSVPKETKAANNEVKKTSLSQETLLTRNNKGTKKDETSVPFKHDHEKPRVVGGNYNPHKKHEEHDDDDKWFTC